MSKSKPQQRRSSAAAAPQQLSIPDGVELLKREMFIASRLKDHGCDVFAGPSDTASRKDLFRRVITERGMDATILAKGADGKCFTYAQAFERTYGEPLEQKSKQLRVRIA
jgi:hypothetical protein